MSMNLHCNMFEMRQTQTHASYMCMIEDSGIVNSEYKGKKALAVLKRYQQWYEWQLQDILNYKAQSNTSEEEYKETAEYHEELIKKLEDTIKDIETNHLDKLVVTMI